MLLRNEGELVVIAQVDDWQRDWGPETEEWFIADFSVTTCPIEGSEFPIKVVTIAHNEHRYDPFSHFELVGPYLVCKKVHEKTHIFFTKLDLDNNGLIKTVQLEQRRW